MAGSHIPLVFGKSLVSKISTIYAPRRYHCSIAYSSAGALSLVIDEVDISTENMWQSENRHYFAVSLAASNSGPLCLVVLVEDWGIAKVTLWLSWSNRG